jgi:hypothetical protein
MQCKLICTLLLQFYSRNIQRFSPQEIFLSRDFVILCVLHTLLSPYGKCFSSLISISEGKPSLEPALGTRSPARVGGEEGGRSLSAGVEAEGGEGEAA